MFCGIVETTSLVKSIMWQDGCLHACISKPTDWDDLKIGDSVSVNGVCLTMTSFDTSSFNVTIVPETLRLTNLTALSPGQLVNLERSLKSTDRIGGHQVQGHVDCTGEIIELAKDNSDALLVKIAIPEHLSKYIVNKGFIAIDGMSITVIDVTSTWFTITLIPHTQAVTIANKYQVGSLLNIEVDMMAKYLEKLIGVNNHASNH